MQLHDRNCIFLSRLNLTEFLMSDFYMSSRRFAYGGMAVFTVRQSPHALSAILLSTSFSVLSGRLQKKSISVFFSNSSIVMA